MLGFGGYDEFCTRDIYIVDQCNKFNDNFSYFGNSFKLPEGFIYNNYDTKCYLAGSHQFLVKEIEIYSIEMDS